MGKRQQKQSQKGVWIVAGVAVAAVGLLVALSLSSSGGSKARTPADATVSGERNVKGQATAKVTLTEYADFL